MIEKYPKGKGSVANLFCSLNCLRMLNSSTSQPTFISARPTLQTGHLRSGRAALCSVADLDQYDSDPDPTFQFDAAPEPHLTVYCTGTGTSLVLVLASFLRTVSGCIL